jgi:hypothetical protein
MNKIAQLGRKSLTRIGTAKASFVPFSPSKHPPLSRNIYGCKHNPSHVSENSTIAAQQNLEIVFTSGNLNKTSRKRKKRGTGFEY